MRRRVGKRKGQTEGRGPGDHCPELKGEGTFKNKENNDQPQIQHQVYDVREDEKQRKSQCILKLGIYR